MKQGTYFSLTVVSCLWLAAASFSSGEDVSIMPLGDSLTWGFDGLVDTPAALAAAHSGGYRTDLYSMLTTGSNAVGIQYVGVNNGNASPILTAAGDTYHDGFNGYTINEVDGNLAGSVSSSDGVTNLGGYWLTGGGGTGRAAQTANIVLLQIGTNDMGQGYDPLYNPTNPDNTVGESSAQFAADATLRLQKLITDVQKYEPNATLFVSGLTPSNGNAARLAPFSTDVKNLVATQYSGDQVYYVDEYDPFLTSTGTQNFSLFNDGTHLNAAGYDLMAQTWYNAIEADYNFQEASVPEPSTVWLVALGGGALFGWRRFRRA